MKIRKYLPKDEAQVRKIHLDTYFLGKPISLLTKKYKLFDYAADYYIKKEPESLFVAEDKNNVIGYLFGCLDDKKCPSEANLIPKYLSMTFLLPFMNKKDKKFWSSAISFMFGVIIGKSKELKLKKPENAGHLHINLVPEYRGKGIGSKLLNSFIDYAKSNNVNTIHAGSFRTKVNPNSNFWLKNGFEVYDKVESNYWKAQYPKEKIELVCYSKKI